MKIIEIQCLIFLVCYCLCQQQTDFSSFWGIHMAIVFCSFLEFLLCLTICFPSEMNQYFCYFICTGHLESVLSRGVEYHGGSDNEGSHTHGVVCTLQCLTQPMHKGQLWLAPQNCASLWPIFMGISVLFKTLSFFNVNCYY